MSAFLLSAFVGLAEMGTAWIETPGSVLARRGREGVGAVAWDRMVGAWGALGVLGLGGAGAGGAGAGGELLDSGGGLLEGEVTV